MEKCTCTVHAHTLSPSPPPHGCVTEEKQSCQIVLPNVTAVISRLGLYGGYTHFIVCACQCNSMYILQYVLFVFEQINCGYILEEDLLIENNAFATFKCHHSNKNKKQTKKVCVATMFANIAYTNKAFRASKTWYVTHLDITLSSYIQSVLTLTAQSICLKVMSLI